MKTCFLFFILLLSHCIWAQNDDGLLTISFENSDLKSVIDKIEKQSPYNFYFDDSSLNINISQTGNYEDVTIEELLEKIFTDTVINYHVLNDGNIILTPNSIIDDTLPDGFFGETESNDEVIANNTGQDISKFFDSSTNTKDQIETVNIGKSNKKSIRKRFSLRGTVTNTDTGKALAGAVILVNGRDIGAYTNTKGFYTIELAGGANIIEVSSPGMENFKKQLVLYGDGSYNIDLREKIEFLDAVVLQADYDKNVNEVVTKTEIDVEEAKNIPLVLGERDVLKVATTLPGITTAGEGASGYNVRGGKSDQNLILLDNAVIYNPQHFFGIFSALNPFAISDAEIYKSSIPAEYGGRLSSVFDLKTKEASVNKVKVEGSIGPVTGNLMVETPIVKGKSGLLVGGRGAYANWILNSLDEESLQDSEASFYDVMAKYNHRITENSSIKATAYMSRDDFSITSDSLYIYGNSAFSLGWNYRFNEKNKGELILSNSQYKFDIEFDGDSNDNFELGYKINESEVKFRFEHLYSDRIKFDYGISSKLYSINPGSIKPKGEASIISPLEIEKERALESAAFLGSVVDLTKKLSLDLGLRYSVYNFLGEGSQNVYQEGQPRSEGSVVETLFFDKNEIVNTYGGPEFRLSGRYLLSDDFSFKLSYNKTFQFLHTLSNNTTVSPVDTFKLSDLNIEPQSSQQYVLGFYKNFKESTYETSLEGFYKRSKNIVDFKTGAELLLNENIETEVLQGEGKSYGVEFLMKKNKGKLNGWLGYTYSRSFIQLDSPFAEERVNNGDFFPSNFDKPHNFNFVANYKFTKRFSLSSNFVYQTGRPVTFPEGNFSFQGEEFAIFSDRNAFRIPDFYRLDIGLNIEGNHKRNKLAHSFITISVYNVLGRNNPFSVFFVTEDGEIKGLQSSIFSVPVPSITYNFKF